MCLSVWLRVGQVDKVSLPIRSKFTINALKILYTSITQWTHR